MIPKSNSKRASVVSFEEFLMGKWWMKELICSSDSGYKVK
jgi:hypothetical protein